MEVLPRSRCNAPSPTISRGASRRRRKGRLVGIELKAGRGRLSPAQIETHVATTLAGGIVTLCRSLDDVTAFLATLSVPSRAHGAISGRKAA